MRWDGGRPSCRFPMGGSAYPLLGSTGCMAAEVAAGDLAAGGAGAAEPVVLFIGTDLLGSTVRRILGETYLVSYRVTSLFDCRISSTFLALTNTDGGISWATWAAGSVGSVVVWCSLISCGFSLSFALVSVLSFT